MKKYSIGVDFGSLSGRTVLVDLTTGEEIAVSTMEYPHKIMDMTLPDGTMLGADFALQHPKDYLDVLRFAVRDVLNQSGALAQDVIGIGIDFTACTILPVLSDGTPLCFLEEYKNEPHSYVKLWKHHAAQDEANTITGLAKDRNEKWIARYGGKISSEWLFPKAVQILNESPEIFAKTERFIEAGDWIVWQLTGKETHSSCMAGYKAMWHKQEGYPPNEFFKLLDSRLDGIIGTKVADNILPIGSKAGELDKRGAELTGLNAETAVAVAIIDAHAALPAVGIVDSGKMLMIMGTSTCHIIMDDNEKSVPGISGVVEDGVVPGLFGYEAGQACVGDHFDWFVKNCVPQSYMQEAEKREVSIHQYLREKAKQLKVGESGLLALDWWNGNRTPLVDADLTGMIIGMTLKTKPEEIYRALIEATAYGTKMIIDTYEENGVAIKELFAAGGIAEKDELMMQIYADVTNREIKISASPQAPALGSAMFGAVAGGYFANIAEAAMVMAKVKETKYEPIKQNALKYQKLYEEYKLLHDYFGQGINNVMKRLKKMSEK